MQINRLKLDKFRNYESLDMEFSPGTNLIFGDNGQGKTNILEAIYICCFGRSYRSPHEKELIRLGDEEAHINAEFLTEKTKKRFDVHIKKNGTKGVAIDKIPVKRMRDLYGKINLVMFSPEDLELIKRGPSVRRNYLNLEICQLDAVYVGDLITYTKIIRQRNELLKALENEEEKQTLLGTLDVWDLQLAEYGKKIISRRRKFIEELCEKILDIHYDISGKKEKLTVRYVPSVTEDDIYEKLLKAREKDNIYKNTSVGPHRDEIEFIVNGKDLKTFGSQGQQRSCVLSLKLAELAIIEEKRGEKPILLLDDVLSELDRNRQKELIKRIDGMQTIITGTGMDEFIEDGPGNIKRFHIKEAKITE